jgi:hypothetical protein
MIEVRPVRDRRELKAFVELPWKLYRHDPAWVPPLKPEVYAHLDRNKNPFFEHARAEYFVAWRGREAIARISAQVDDEHNRRFNEKTGFFGFFECPDEPAVAAALLDTASSWLRAQGMDLIRGPFNFSINHTAGLLVDGHHSPPHVEMTHNPAYYARLIEERGFGQAMDLYAWKYDATRPPPEVCLQIADAVAQYPGLKVRQLDPNHFDRDIRIILGVFNEAWSQNWGFVPFTDSELRKAARDLKLVIEPRVGLIAEVDGEPAAIALTFPNLNEILHKTRGMGTARTYAKLIWELKVRKRVNSARLMLLGVRPKFRGSVLGGLSVLLYVETHKRGTALGYKEAELSWTLANNEKINAGIRMMGGEVYKTYRIYEKAIA